MNKIPESERVPTKEKTAYAIGQSMDMFAANTTINTLWMPFFNLGLGINAAVLGVILMIYRLWDAFSDPLVGFISDNARTRWGRRRPFILVAAFFVAFLYPAFWYMPNIVQFFGADPDAVFASFSVGGDMLEFTVLSVWLVGFGILFFLVFSFWSMPYYGLQLELTPNYDEKTRVTAAMTVVGKINIIFGALILWLASDWLADKSAGAAGIIVGMQTLCIPFAIVMLIVGVLPALFVKERNYGKSVVSQKKEKFSTSLKESFTCGPLWILIGISFFHVFGATVIGQLGYYVNLFKVSDGAIGDATMLELVKRTGEVVVGLAFIPVWIWLAEKLDKKSVLAIILVGGVLNQFVAFYCIRPDMPYLQVLPAALNAGVSASVWLILPSMKADVADWDELKTGKRREASLNSFYSWFIKAALTASAGATGIVVQYVAGIDPSLETQPAEVVDRLFKAFLIMPGVLLAIPMLFLFFYPLSRKRMEGVRSELEERRVAS
ncbi:MFS transporter [Pelagicoccus mobilis]|uniref:MFS transporter n=1 Tax=Pelagicoccus mobilis TaxID=415221 RepID=A0A934S0M1_9BACT|nr:MFS transporter [Pelagicoccus mobilis]